MAFFSPREVSSSISGGRFQAPRTDLEGSPIQVGANFQVGMSCGEATGVSDCRVEVNKNSGFPGVNISLYYKLVFRFCREACCMW